MSKKATNFLSKKATHCLLSCFFACVALLLSKFLLSKKATQAKKQQQQSNNAKKQCRVPSKEATKQKSNTKSSAKKQQPAKKQQTFRAKKQQQRKQKSNKQFRNWAISQPTKLVACRTLIWTPKLSIQFSSLQRVSSKGRTIFAERSTPWTKVRKFMSHKLWRYWVN